MNLLINTDGGARGNPGPAAIGLVVRDVSSQEVVYQLGKYIGEQTNNVAEYEALVTAVDWLSRFCATQQVQSVTFLLDSTLVVEQVKKNWKVKQAHLLPYCNHIQTSLQKLSLAWTISYVPRAQNAQADALVNQALDQEMA